MVEESANNLATLDKINNKSDRHSKESKYLCYSSDVLIAIGFREA
jgi:hypothetical protein